jgi:hypothetical protein
LNERSDDSSETRLQSDDDILVTWPEVPTLPVFEEADEKEEVVPDTEESYQVIVFETKPEVDDVVVPPAVVTGSTYGGFQLPTESEVDDYLSFSQFSSQLSDQGHTCSHFGDEMSTSRCPICTYGNDHTTCADCNEEWLGNEDACPIGAHGFHNWKRKVVDNEGDDPALKVARRF